MKIDEIKYFGRLFKFWKKSDNILPANTRLYLSLEKSKPLDHELCEIISKELKLNINLSWQAKTDFAPNFTKYRWDVYADKGFKQNLTKFQLKSGLNITNDDLPPPPSWFSKWKFTIVTICLSSIITFIIGYISCNHNEILKHLNNLISQYLNQ